MKIEKCHCTKPNKCKACDSDFPNWILVDGVRKNLSTRSYCLDCKPWKSGNTTKLVNYKNGEKRCSKCRVFKDPESFYKSKAGYYSSMCKVCYGETYRTDYNFLKKRAVEYKGGVCQDCKETMPLCVYDFHHVDPNEKDFKIGGNLKKIDWRVVEQELDKCVLLCANCHRIRHYAD
jgi:hypothetical protein